MAGRLGRTVRRVRVAERGAVTAVWVPGAYVAHDPVAWDLLVGSLLGLGLCLGVWSLVELAAYVTAAVRRRRDHE